MKEIKKYLDVVCEQIRFQKAHDSIKEELQDHIIDQAEAFMKEGIEEKRAFELAVAEMGDPVLVGTELDRVHRPKLEWSMIGFIALLSFAHIVVQYLFFSDVFAVESLWKNILMLLFYIGVMILFYHIDFTILAKYGKLYYGVYVVLLALFYCYTSTSGYFLLMDLTEPHAAILGGFTDIYYMLFSVKLPILIYFFPVILSGLLYSCRGKTYKELFLCCFSILPVVFFCYYHLLKIPCILVSMVCFALILLSIAKNWFAVKKKYAVLLVVAMVIITILLIKWLDLMDYNYSSILYEYIKKIQVILQNNIKSSCVIGEGNVVFTQNENGLLINGIDFLKQWVEYFLAYVLHYGGWLALLFLLAIYFFFVIKGFLLIKKQKSQLGFMTATAILLTFLLISVWNIVANTGIFLISNPLGIPFFSTSDSINIVFFALVGILLSVFRTGHMTMDKHIIIQKKTKKRIITVCENGIHIDVYISLPFKQNKMEKISKNH